MLKRFIHLVIAVLCTLPTAACPFGDRAVGLDFYPTLRLLGDDMQGTDYRFGRAGDNSAGDNCRAWQQLTSRSIPADDIRQIVYSCTASQLADLHDAVEGKWTMGKDDGNAFTRWLVRHHDTETTRYLLLAKRCEQVRGSCNTAWYYPVWGDVLDSTLTAVADEAARYRGHRLADRYALQQLRALFVLHRYDQCLNVWKDKKHLFRRGGFLRDMAEGYVAGALLHLGDTATAERMYMRLGDIASVRLCQRGDGAAAAGQFRQADFLRALYDYDPNDRRLLPQLQHCVHECEIRIGPYYGEDPCTQTFEAVLALARRAISERKSHNMAAWYYVAAVVGSRLGQHRQAWRDISEASRHKAGADLRDAIRIFSAYARVRAASRYDEQLEQWLTGELQWMDRQLALHLTPAVRQRFVRDGLSSLKGEVLQEQTYYWNDMMRKTLVCAAAPLCIRSGYRVRALQYVNMADNDMLLRTGRVSYTVEGDVRTVPLSTYRASTRLYNAFDYTSDFFICLDSIGTAPIRRLIWRMDHPESALDSLLLAHSYTDRRYLYDILGTQLMAEMKYGEAAAWLAKVPASFQRSRNFFTRDTQSDYGFSTGCTQRDPFTGERLRQKDYLQKLHFAQTMARLERRMRSARDPNTRAEAMIKYAQGLRHSVSDCWQLTCYFQSTFVNSDYGNESGTLPYYAYPDRYQSDARRIARRWPELEAQALRLFTDEERAAAACRQLSLFRTAATRYASTQTADFLRRHCDQLRDYRPRPCYNFRPQ